MEGWAGPCCRFQLVICEVGAGTICRYKSLPFMTHVRNKHQHLGVTYLGTNVCLAPFCNIEPLHEHP